MALSEIIQGNPKNMQSLFSPPDNVSMDDAFRPGEVGRKQVMAPSGREAARMQEGEPRRFEHLVKAVTPGKAF